MKDSAHFQIIFRVLELENSAGHLKWKVSDLARFSGVSRPLIYYHFGRTKSAILTECLSQISVQYYGFNEASIQALRDGQLFESVMKTRELLAQNPGLVIFYLKWRAKNSPLQKQLIQFEVRYQAKIRRAFPRVNRAQAILIHGLLHGLVTAPFLTTESIAEGSKLIMKLLRPAP